MAARRAMGVRERALRSLARSEQTRAELTARLSRHAGTDEVAQVVSALADAGLQSDRRAAEQAARLAERKGMTRRRAAEWLAERGHAGEHVLPAVTEAFAHAPTDPALEQEALERLRATADPRAQRALARRLVQRGVDPERVQAVLEERQGA